MVKYSSQAIAIMINHADTGSVVDPESGLRPALVLFDGLNEQTFGFG